MVYDPGLGKLVLFGGDDTNANVLGDTWTTDGSTWKQAAPATSPPARSDEAMAYDPTLGEIVLFGGLDGSNTSLSDTWAYNGTTWSEMTPATSPPARAYASMAFDAATGQLVLFGGLSGTSTLSDTWTFDGTTWSEVTPATSPPARSDASMDYDPATGRLVLFGGLSGTSTLSDTWTFDGTTWSEATPATSPPARSDAAMDYDAATGQLVLSGGLSTVTPPATLGDTWTYNGTTWAHASSPTSPPARSNALFAFDPATSELVLFGGLDANSNTLSDTWLSTVTPTAATWVAAAPPARSDDVMANDAALGKLVLFGGLSGSNTALSDTWTYNGTSWVQQVPTTSPPARSFASMAYDPASGQLVLFGGLAADNTTTLGDTWVYTGTTWRLLSPPVTPGPHSDASLTYDPGLGKLVLFGGLDAYSDTLSDTWAFNGTTWTPMGPSARSDFASAFDSATNQLVVFGGLDVNSNTLGDTWIESGSTWTQIAGPGPAARSYASMAYDPAIGKVVLFGGLAADGVTALGDTWAFNGTSWSQLSPAYVPQARSDASLTYDNALGELVLFGGILTSGTVQQDTWLFTGTTWAKLVLSNKPAARSDAAMAYDAATGQVVLFGGLDTYSTALGDTWAFNGTTWSQLSPATSPSARSFAAMAYDPATKQVVLLGGLDTNSTTLGDEWTFASGTWSARTGVALPSARSDTVMLDDSATGQLVLFGGLDSNVNTLADTWTSSGTAWVPLTPQARSDAAMDYDAASGQLVVFGGLDVNSNTLGDTWSMTGTTWGEDTSTSAPSARAFAAMAYDPTSASLVLFGGTDNNFNTLGDEWTFASGTWTAQTASVLPGPRSDDTMVEDSSTNQLVLFGGLDTYSNALAETWALTTAVAQSVAFTSNAPNPAVAGGATYTPTASATSGLPVAITLDPSSTGCALAGGAVTFTAIGTCVLDADQPGNSSYAPAPQVQQSIPVVATQSVAFTSSAPSPALVGGPTYTPSASATSGLAVTLTLDASSTGCALAGGAVTFTAIGTCVLDADQPGNSSYAPAAQVQQSISIVATQSIAFTSSAPSPAVPGGATYTPAANASLGATGRDHPRSLLDRMHPHRRGGDLHRDRHLRARRRPTREFLLRRGATGTAVDLDPRALRARHLQRNRFAAVHPGTGRDLRTGCRGYRAHQLSVRHLHARPGSSQCRSMRDSGRDQPRRQTQLRALTGCLARRLGDQRHRSVELEGDRAAAGSAAQPADRVGDRHADRYVHLLGHADRERRRGSHRFGDLRLDDPRLRRRDRLAPAGHSGEPVRTGPARGRRVHAGSHPEMGQVGDPAPRSEAVVGRGAVREGEPQADRRNGDRLGHRHRDRDHGRRGQAGQGQDHRPGDPPAPHRLSALTPFTPAARSVSNGGSLQWMGRSVEHGSAA